MRWNMIMIDVCTLKTEPLAGRECMRIVHLVPICLKYIMLLGQKSSQTNWRGPLVACLPTMQNGCRFHNPIFHLSPNYLLIHVQLNYLNSFGRGT